MATVVQKLDAGHCLEGDWEFVGANRFLQHLGFRAFSVATVKAYAFDVLDFSRFLQAKSIPLIDGGPIDIFEGPTPAASSGARAICS